MIRQYRFSELMARLKSEQWTVIKDSNGRFLFMPVAYKGRRL